MTRKGVWTPWTLPPRDPWLPTRGAAPRRRYCCLIITIRYNCHHGRDGRAQARAFLAHLWRRGPVATFSRPGRSVVPGAATAGRGGRFENRTRRTRGCIPPAHVTLCYSKSALREGQLPSYPSPRITPPFTHHCLRLSSAPDALANRQNGWGAGDCDTEERPLVKEDEEEERGGERYNYYCTRPRDRPPSAVVVARRHI